MTIYIMKLIETPKWRGSLKTIKFLEKKNTQEKSDNKDDFLGEWGERLRK